MTRSARFLTLFLPFLCLLAAGPALAQEPDLVLAGELTGADHQSYVYVPFTVPEGVAQISVSFGYSGREQRTTVDLGLFDPDGFRGWSGGNKSAFTLAESFATPSYLPGPIAPGEWQLVLGIPNIREGVTARYEAEIRFETVEALPQPRRETAAGWMWGDFHTHTGHSDGSCDNPGGTRVPCPVFRTVEAALEAGLDFLAITDHNTVSHHNVMTELAPYYDDLLLVPGAEITTFFGHANVIGAAGFTEFRVTGRESGFDAVLDDAEAAGAIVSINHPGLPSGEACMGCGFVAQIEDWGRVAAIEAVNGSVLARAGTVDHPMSGLRVWEARLNEGHRITAIAGSDNHDPAAPADRGQVPVGWPSTAVWTQAPTQAALLEGVRSGRVFIDLEGRTDRTLDLGAAAGDAQAVMGGALDVSGAPHVDLEVRLAGVDAGRVVLVGPGGELAREDLGPDGPESGERQVRFRLDGADAPGWVRAQVLDEGGATLMIGNPVYLLR